MEGWRQVPFKKSCLVSGWDATHWRSARALQTRLDTCAVRFGGESIGYTDTISWRRAGMIPGKEVRRLLWGMGD